MQEKNCTKLKPSPIGSLYIPCGLLPRLSDHDLLHVPRLDGKLEGLGAVLTHTLHTLDSILVSSVVGPVHGEIQLFVSTKHSKQQ